MALLKIGDRVRLSSREATPQDLKTGLFFNHYRGLTGAVRKVYPGEEIAVEIEPDELPEDIWKRHMSTRDQMRQRWLEGLTDEVRRRLKPEQKEFSLRYIVLVSARDLEKRRAKRPA